MEIFNYEKAVTELRRRGFRHSVNEGDWVHATTGFRGQLSWNPAATEFWLRPPAALCDGRHCTHPAHGWDPRPLIPHTTAQPIKILPRED
jgi:hypothetical protein